MSERRFWIGVVSREHVVRGVEGGFAQLCHGKAAPLRKMRAGDWLVYYSPGERREKGAPVQAFTAIGRVREGEAYTFRMSDDFIPFRRDIEYLAAAPAPIRPLIPELSFIRDKTHWGGAFRFGHLSVPEDDFRRIAGAMGVELDAHG